VNKYDIIYADPPWSFKTWSEKGKDRSAEKHYSTMDLEEIINLPIHELSNENSVLFLWATSPLISQAFETMKAWGFTYKTFAFVWIKSTIGSFPNPFVPANQQVVPHCRLHTGMGYYTRANAEYCLLGTRGKPLSRRHKGVHQVVLSPVQEHSRKPDEVANRIVQLFGERPRIELFARKLRAGWDSWGNEL